MIGASNGGAAQPHEIDLAVGAEEMLGGLKQIEAERPLRMVEVQPESFEDVSKIIEGEKNHD